MLTDYRTWVLSFHEVILFLAVLVLGGMTVGWLFFDSITVGTAAGILCLPLLSKYRTWRMKRRQRELLVQFRDLLYSVASSVSVGRNLSQALEESIDFWKGTYDDADLIMQEARHMVQCMQESRARDVDVLRDFAERSGLPDVMDFAGVYENCKTSGANLIQAISRASAVIGDRIALEQELHALLAQKQFESRVVMASPFLLLFFLKILSPEYLLPLTQSAEGRFISLLSLGLVGAACILMERVTRVEI